MSRPSITGEVVVHVRYAGGVYSATATSTEGRHEGRSTLSAEEAVQALASKLGMSKHARSSAWIRHDQVHLQCLLGDEQLQRDEMPTTQHSLLTLHLALAIADESARSDIEVYARGGFHPDGWRYHDLSQAQNDGPDNTPENNERALAIARRAARYIELRGDVFPWEMQCGLESPHLVRFVDKAG